MCDLDLWHKLLFATSEAILYGQKNYWCQSSLLASQVRSRI